MSKTPKAAHTGDANSRSQSTAGKLRFYETLCTLNQSFEQVLQQLQELEKLGLGRQPWKALRTIVEENRAEINFELVERLQEREQTDWAYFGRRRRQRRQREKKLADPQDVLIEADRMRAQQKKRRAQGRRDRQK